MGEKTKLSKYLVNSTVASLSKERARSVQMQVWVATGRPRAVKSSIRLLRSGLGYLYQSSCFASVHERFGSPVFRNGSVGSLFFCCSGNAPWNLRTLKCTDRVPQPKFCLAGSFANAVDATWSLHLRMRHSYVLHLMLSEQPEFNQRCRCFFVVTLLDDHVVRGGSCGVRRW